MTIARIFGKSPFSPLKKHILKVADCIDLLPSLFLAKEKENTEKVEEISKTISDLKHDADRTKQDIHTHLPKSLFMAVDRSTILTILSLQDTLAHLVEEIGILATYLPLEKFDKLKNTFVPFYKKNMDTFYLAKLILEEFNTLLESSFGGLEAEKVKEMIDDLSRRKDEATKLKQTCYKELYHLGNEISHHVFVLWIAFIQNIAKISIYSEKLGNQIRMVLMLK